MRQLCLYVAVLCLCSGMASALHLPVQVSFSQFRADSGTTRVELNFAFPDSMVVYRKVENQYRAKLHFALRLVGESSDYKDNWDVIQTVQSSRDPLRNSIVGTRSFDVLPGRYTVHLRWVDSVRTSRVDSLTQILIVRKIAPHGLACSDLLLCSSISNASEDQSHDPFNRNGLICVPLPSSELRGESPTLHTYIELYGLDDVKCDSVDLAYHILDGADREVLEATERKAIHAGAMATIFEQILDVIPSGVYSVHCAVSFPQRPDIDTIGTSTKFYILNPQNASELSGLRSEDQLFLASEFATMNEWSIEQEYEKAMIVGPETELLSFHQLSSLLAKQKYIYRFWYAKDPDPTTAVNERYEELRKAVRYAEANYKGLFSARGWDSDRGRVLLKYGFPTQKDPEIYNTDGAYPHEIWTYDNIQGGVQFVFVNLYNRGKYVLVHSTALNEKHEPNWYDMYATDRSKRY